MVLSLSERQKELVTGFLIIGIMAGGWGVGEALLRLVRRGQFGKAARLMCSECALTGHQGTSVGSAGA